MSYILEALKKAQAERQVGSAPTIHAPALVPPPASRPAASGRPLLIGLGAGALVVAVAALVAWRQQGPAPAAAPVVVAASMPAAGAGTAAAVPAPAPLPEPVAVPRTTARPAPAVVAAPRPPAPAVLAKAAPLPAPAVAEPAARAAAAKPAPLPEPAVAAERDAPRAISPAARETPAVANPTRAAPPVVAGGAQAEAEPGAYAAVRSLQSLPEVIQREVPKIAVGGYIYSQNAEDRLLLIDKTLRREGEEVAPGLMLERLLPKAAIMNYRGYRYRVPY